MKRFTNYTLGARDVILLLEELHKRGYERMRFFGYLSPNGMAYRVHLAHRDAMSENGYELEGEAIWYSSVGPDCCGLSADSLADEFLEEFAEHPDLLRAKAVDSDYVQWFRRVVELACRGIYPNPYSDDRIASICSGYIDTIGEDG